MHTSLILCCSCALVCVCVQPEGWTEQMDPNGNLYYYNATTGQSSRQHPLDEYYQNLYLKLKMQRTMEVAGMAVPDDIKNQVCITPPPASCHIAVEQCRLPPRTLKQGRLPHARSSNAALPTHAQAMPLSPRTLKQCRSPPRTHAPF